MTNPPDYGHTKSMILKKFYLRNDQSRFFNRLKGNFSEYMRQAVDDFIFKKKKEELNVSASISETTRKGDQPDGTTISQSNPA